MEDFEHGLDSVLTDSVDTPDMDESLDEADAMPSSVSSGFLHLVSTVCVTSNLQIAPSIKLCQLWCQAKVQLLPAL